MQKVLFIYQNAYSQTGGIQTFNKYFISALEDIKNEVENFNAELLSIYDNDKDIQSNLKFTTLNNNKLMSFQYILKNYKNYNTFIFAHINLAPLAIFLKLLNPNAKIYFCTHGIEIWKKLPIYTEWIMNKSTILTVSNFSKKQLIKYNKALKDIKLFPNCIKHNELSKILDNPYKKNEFNILSVTRLSEGEKLKGIDTMIKTIPLLKEKIPNLKYSVIGKGEDLIRLKKLAKDLNVENYISFLGFVDDINAYYQHCDIFSLPSKKEGFGIVYLEAMQYKKPVIGVNYGGPTDVIQDGKTGYLCEYDDIDCLADKIIQLYKNEDLNIKIGNAGYEYFINNFTFSQYKKNLKEVLK
jgi:glycosyltransferase involved in cell wall biosynthesis